MAIHHHQISLESDQPFHGRLPTHHLGFLLADLPVAIRCAVSMAIRNRSKTPGKQPEWLQRASDIRFIGHDGNGLAHLRFELPSLNEAVSEVYQQPWLIDSDRPDGRLSGLDLLMAIIRDIDAGKADSNAFDPQLLHQIARFKRFFRSSPFTAFRIGGSEPAAGETRVTSATTENSLRLYGRTPMPQRSRIVGQLDGLEASTQRFSLVLDSGERVPGVFPEELSDQLQQLWRARVLVVGTSVFRASGNLLRVEAETIAEGTGVPALFSRTPTASSARIDPNRLRKSQNSRSGMAAIMGRWPGDETDEQIERALEQIG